MPPVTTSQSTFSTLLSGNATTTDASDAASEHIDHRKRRRNRTTQSCLNCHTSKRKCDRKRPCQRCTQLGLTGLCVYEVDDPVMRGDPTADETTRLRGRVAELERLVRELRGKPSPRWAEDGYRHNDLGERWHSRAMGHAKSGSNRWDSTTSEGNYEVAKNISSSLLPGISIKTEAHGDTRMWRLSSPSAEHSPCSVDSTDFTHHNDFSSSPSSDQQTSAGLIPSSYWQPHDDRPSYELASSPDHATSTVAIPAAVHQTPSPSGSYGRQTGSAPASFSGSRNPGFTVNIPENTSPHRYCHSDASPGYGLNSSGQCDPMVSSYCPCRNSAHQVYCNLLGHLESSVQALNAPCHGHQSGGGFCQLYRRVLELDNSIRNAVEPQSAVSSSSYTNSSISDLPTHSEFVHSPTSIIDSQGMLHDHHSPYHGSIGSGVGVSTSAYNGPGATTGTSPTHWHTVSSPVPGGYNPYFGAAVSHQEGYLNTYAGASAEI